jgi:hypothetical protein
MVAVALGVPRSAFLADFQPPREHPGACLGSKATKQQNTHPQKHLYVYIGSMKKKRRGKHFENMLKTKKQKLARNPDLGPEISLFS